MSRKYRLIGSFYVRPNSSIWVAYDGDPFSEQSIASGLYYALGDASAEDVGDVIFQAIEDAGGDKSSWGLDINLDTGVATITNNDADCVISFVNPVGGTLERNSLPLLYALFPELRGVATQISINASTSSTSARQSEFSLYPRRWLFKDLPAYLRRGAQSRADAGNVSTLNVASLRDHMIRVQMNEAYPRAAVRNEFDAMADFLEQAASGRPVRLYPDKSVTTPYNRDTNPFGYSEWTVEHESTDWAPEPAFNNYYQIFEHDINLLEYVE